jgi:hypothetical protein
MGFNSGLKGLITQCIGKDRKRQLDFKEIQCVNDNSRERINL